MADIVKRIEELMDLFDEGEVTTANKIQRPSDPFREFEERNPQADGGRIKLQGGTDIKTRQGFQPGNPGNIKSLRELNISRKQGQDQRVVRFKELVRAGSIPNEAKKKVIEQFKLDRNPKAGTPTWMTKGKEQLIAEGFDYQASARGPKNVGGVEKAAQKRKQVIGEGRKFEERIKRTKQKTGLGRQYELAHTANIFQAKKLDIDYPIDALAIQTQDVNNKVAEALNDELKPLYRKQLKLVNKLKRKSTEGLKNQLDKVNNDLLEVVATGGKQGSKAANVLKPIIVNRDTLKGYIYTGAFDSFAELQASPGATTKTTKAGSPDDLMARLNIGRQVGKNNLQKLAAIGCPGKMMGGRITLAKGENLSRCAVRGINKLQTTDPKKLTLADRANYKSIRKTSQGARVLKNVLGPAALAIEALFVAPFAAFDYASGRRGKDIALSALSLGLADQKLRRDELKEYFPEYGKGQALLDLDERLMELERLQKGTRGQRVRSKGKLNIGLKKFDEAIKQFPTEESLLDNLEKSRQAEMDLTEDEAERKKQRLSPSDFDQFSAAGGGIAKLAGVDSGPPPPAGPNSQGLQGLMKRVRNR